MKISEFLETLDSHSIYKADELAKDFRESTGLEPCWPTHSETATKRQIEARGLGGYVDDGLGDAAFGHEIAKALAEKYANFKPFQIGRGSAFRACLDAIKQAESALEEEKKRIVVGLHT